MKDPFATLGLPREATEEQIQEAYRQKAATLPMNDQSDPRVQALNDAYDEAIWALRNQSPYGDRPAEPEANAFCSDCADIRRLLGAGRVLEAEELLDGTPISSRTAEWYFLKGSTAYDKGYLDAAYEYFQMAAQMSPENQEYASAFNTVSQETLGSMKASPYGSAVNAACNCCNAIICVNCCCSCTKAGFCGY